MTALATVAHLAATDPAFRDLLATDPEAALRSRHVSLGEDERKLLSDLRAALTRPARKLANHLENWMLGTHYGWGDTP